MARSENLTVLLTDIVGFSEKTVASSRRDMGELLRIHNRLLKSTVRFYGGQYVKSTGDGMLAVFRTTTNAVQCGMAIQDTIAEYNEVRQPEDHIHVRVALNLGEVSWSGNKDVVGEAVNTTARIEAVTPADEVYLSGTVYLAMNKAEVPTRFVDKVQLKGISEPVAIHKVPRNEKAVLVATGEPVDADEHVLPFGGMPRPSAISRRERLGSFLRQPWVIVSGTAVLTLLLMITLAYNAGWLSPEGKEFLDQVIEPAPLFRPSNATEDAGAPDATTESPALLETGKALLRQDRLDELQALIERTSHEGAPAAHIRLLQGHLAFRKKDLQQAMGDYAAALEEEQALRYDDLLARNLVSTLGYLSKPAARLLRENTTPAMIDYLAQRTAQPGPLGRSQAVRLLHELGHPQRIDLFSHGRLSLAEASNCEQHKSAIASLQRSGNREAIPLLEDALGDGLGDWFRTRCWRDTAKAAVAALQAEGGE